MYKILRNIPDKHFLMVVASGSFLIGVLARLPYLVSDDLFPLGDGGLFVEMINSIKANHFMLPRFVVYNHVQIPFAYPPLGFYLAIIVSRLFELPTLFVVRYLPIVINLLTIIAFVMLSSEIFKDRPTILIGSMIFPVILQVYLWTIKGGGISRSPGFLFSTLTLYFICLYERKERGYYLVAGLFSLAAAILSHPEWALVAPVSVAVFFLLKSRHSWKKRIQLMLALYIGAAILTAPWWGTVLYRFGILPLMMAAQVAKMDLNQFVGDFLDGRMLSVDIILRQDYFISFLAMVGVIVSLYKKDFFLPFWLVAVYIAAPKNAPIPGLIPLVLLSAIGIRGIDDLLLNGLHFLKAGQGVFKRLIDALIRAFSFFPASGVYLIIVIPLSLVNLIKQPVLHPIKQSDRAAMQFVAKTTPQDARFVVLTSLDWFEADAVEWFPLLADRQSLTTPQGLEWVSSSEFMRIRQLTAELSSLVRLELAGNDSGEIVRYVEANFKEFEYVVVFANDLEGNFGGFLETGRFELVYSKNNVLIFFRTSAKINQ
jgi:hypothetical protein